MNRLVENLKFVSQSKLLCASIKVLNNYNVQVKIMD